MVLKRDFYYDSEIAEMLNVSVDTIRLLCVRGDFNLAEKLADGQWIIPSNHFKMKANQPSELNEKIRELEENHRRRILSNELDEFDFEDE